MAQLNITGFGVEIADLQYDGFLDWFVAYFDPVDLWRAHKSYLLCEVDFLVGAALTLVHALKQGGRWPLFWVATVCHGFTVELMAYFFPHIDNFWHAQSMLTFIERRMPLYIMFLYTVFYYHATWAMSKMRLKSQLAEHMAVGLMTVLIDMPYDINGAKYVHWVWHDTDPNIAERHYWVPWNSYYFHSCFSISFQFFYHNTRKWIDRRDLDKWQRGTLKSELGAIAVAALLGMPGGCLLFIPLYHPLHDFYGVPSEITSITILMFYAAIVWKFDRKSNRHTTTPQQHRSWSWIDRLLIGHLIGHYALNLATAVFIDPEQVVSVGVHERIGNCDERVPVETILLTLSKRKYLCVDDYDEKYYDFHCLPDGKPAAPGSYWYTICGTAFDNHVEYVTVMALICFVAFMVFSSLHCDDFDGDVWDRLSDGERQRLLNATKKPSRLESSKSKAKKTQ